MSGRAVAASEPLLVAEDLRVKASGRSILELDRLELYDGELLALLGPNGAGKSTLLRTLALLDRPSRGSVRLRGVDAADCEPELRKRSAMVFQRPHLWHGSVRLNLELGLRLRGVRRQERRRRAEEAAEQLGIGGLLETPSTRLSAGEVQRVAIARALAVDPEILLLDEPTANLDAEVRASLREDLERVARRRTRTTLVATHDRGEAFHVADRVAALARGRIVQSGTPSELFENPADAFVAAVTGAEFSLRGTVVESGNNLLQVRVGDVVLTAVGKASPGNEVRISYRAEDLFLSREELAGGSPRNRFAARVRELRPIGGLVRIRLQGPDELVALVTRAAAEELSLQPGAEVHVQVKATALHAFEV